MLKIEFTKNFEVANLSIRIPYNFFKVITLQTDNCLIKNSKKMKRRNADCTKLRRPIKRNKIAESVYCSTTVLYMKFLVLWAIVITADFMFMFRFEFLWPFWLLLRSVHDSFKYKGLAFSVLFVCIAITSDLVCLFFIPVHWLFFAASTYVWVQYVWHTDKGICLPTIILWMLFVYIEAGIRWKDSRHMPHLDLCRPFAAHCIGYPVVTLGFGFKSYVGYRMRQRKQREVGKENEFYMQLLQQALPQEDPIDDIQIRNTITASNAGTSTQNAQISLQSNSTTTVTTTNAISTNGNLVNQAQNHNYHQNDIHSAQSNLNSNYNHQKSNIVSTATATTVTNSTTTTTTACDKNYIQIIGSSPGSASLNGHIGGNTKNNRRSIDKENKIRTNGFVSGNGENESKCNKINNNIAGNVTSGVSKEKDKLDGDNNIYQINHSQPFNSKDKNEEQKSGPTTNSSKKSNNNSGAVHLQNGNVLQYDADYVIVEPVEKNKGRRNRSKRDNSSKDNHINQHNNYNLHANNNSNHNHPTNKEASLSQNNNFSDASSVSSSVSSNSSKSNTSAISSLASKVVSKICESCLKLESDIKKYRSEISNMKQIENELRQKLESNLTTRSCLQAKQKECEELEKRTHELANLRHADMLQLQAAERRLTEERRQKQSVDSQLSNEKRARKIAEEKAARPECSTQCKQRKQQMEDEIKILRRELKLAEEAKQLAEQHGRKREHELRMFEAEIRNRDSNQPGTEMLMNALSVIQEKNCTLEKNLSAETRVKLDLFSALGDAKRQLEISENRRRAKEEEVLDLRAKVAQFLAVMPTDSLCLPACSSTNAGSLLCMNDTPPLQTGPGPASPMLVGLSNQQTNVSVQGGHQMNTRLSQSSVEYVSQGSSDYVNNQKQCGNVVSISTLTGSLPGNNASGSNLDPNASAYTPKNCPNSSSGNGVVVVGGAGDT